MVPGEQLVDGRAVQMDETRAKSRFIASLGMTVSVIQRICN